MDLISKEIWANYISSDHNLSEITYNEQPTWVGKINDSNLEEIETIKQSDALFNKLDPTVLMAVMVSRKAFTESGWSNFRNWCKFWIIQGCNFFI